jgi:glycosyltransferase involved in cell wall biosynthesis
VVAIAHGWTAATWKVRVNEALDRRVMRRVDCVVGVSEMESKRVRRAGVRPDCIVTIPNSISPDNFASVDPTGRVTLEKFFDTPPRLIVLAAGRLSQEKGFDQLIEAAAEITKLRDDVGFILFGDGPLREALSDKIVAANLDQRFVLGGFRKDICRLLPHADMLVLSSHTEGLPVILLEGLAAGVPVVATAVGGVGELIEDGRHGLLVEPGHVDALAKSIGRLATDADLRSSMSAEGPKRIEAAYSCSLQSQRYQQLFERLTGHRAAKTSELSDKSLSLELHS